MSQPYAYAAFRFALFANGDGTLPALIAAHRFLAASAMAFLPAALSLRLRFAGTGVGAGATAASGFFGGLPRRFVGPWRTSMARVSFSRSAIRRAMIWSVGIGGSVANGDGQLEHG